MDSNRATALAELLTTSLSDADVQRIAKATAAMMAERVRLDDFPELLRPVNQAEAAAWLGINPSTLSQWTAQDDDPVPAFRLGTKPVYLKAELIDWLRSRRIDASHGVRGSCRSYAAWKSSRHDYQRDPHRPFTGLTRLQTRTDTKLRYNGGAFLCKTMWSLIWTTWDGFSLLSLPSAVGQCSAFTFGATNERMIASASTTR